MIYCIVGNMSRSYLVVSPGLATDMVLGLESCMNAHLTQGQ